jgi:hypothetical protein
MTQTEPLNRSNPAPRDASLPISINQEKRLLVEAVMNRRHELPFHIPLALELTGELSEPALRLALNKVVRRHDALRATFWPDPNVDPILRQSRLISFANSGKFLPGLFRQSIAREAEVPLRVMRVDHLEPNRRENEIREHFSAEFLEPFDFTKPPLLRGLLIKVEPKMHLLFLTLHHMAGDLCSLPILEEEIRTFYGDGALPSLDLQFTDFAAWQQKQASNSGFEKPAHYWKDQWAAFEGDQVWYRDLPFALQGTNSPTRNVGIDRIVLNKDMSARIEAFAEKSRSSFYMVMLAAFNLVMRARTSKSRIAIWSNFANRVLPGTDRLIGWFVNSHLVGVDMSSEPSGLEFLLGVKASVLGAASHQQIPTAVLWRSMPKVPIHSDLTIVLNTGAGPSAPQPDFPSGLKITRTSFPHIDTMKGQTGLHLNIVRRAGETTVFACYSRDRFIPGSVSELLMEYRSVIHNLIVRPTDPISTLAPIAKK